MKKIRFGITGSGFMGRTHAEAVKRLAGDASLVALRAVGVDAPGEIGSDDPLQAIEDAIRSFAPDEIVIATHPEGRSNWLERDLVAHTRERFALPVAHVVVDPDVD